MATILFITGPSGAGKTTVCNEFLKRASGTWAYVNQDDIRQQVKAGYVSIDGLEKNWTVEARRQLAVSIPICVSIARHYQDAGMNCIVDFYATLEDFRSWKRVLGDSNYKLVVLLPSQETVLSRNRSRKRRARLTDAKVVEAYQNMLSWLSAHSTINTTDLPVEETVKHLLLLVASH